MNRTHRVQRMQRLRLSISRRTEVDVSRRRPRRRTRAAESPSGSGRGRSCTEKSCSGHSPPLSHTGQSSGWLISRNSKTPARASTHLGRARVHHHAVGADGRARRLQLRHLLDLDDADPAGAVDAERRVIAVVRDLDAVLERRLEDGRPLLDGERPAVNGERDCVHRGSGPDHNGFAVRLTALQGGTTLRLSRAGRGAGLQVGGGKEAADGAAASSVRFVPRRNRRGRVPRRYRRRDVSARARAALDTVSATSPDGSRRDPRRAAGRPGGPPP